MSEQHEKPDHILSVVGEALSVVGAGESVARVSAALDQAGVSYGDTLLFIPAFLAFYADARDLDLTQLMQNIQADTEKTLKAIRRLRLDPTEKR
jgi:hypothetical protein